MKIKKPKSKVKTADDLWAEIIKLRAGRKSEISGSTDHLGAHHLISREYRGTRWDYDNGICLTRGEHKFMAHSHLRDKRERFENRVRELCGENIFVDLLWRAKTRKGTDVALKIIRMERDKKALEAILALAGG